VRVLVLPGVGLLLAALTEILRLLTGRSILPPWGSILFIILGAGMAVVMIRKEHPALGEADGFSTLNLHRSENHAKTGAPSPRVADLLRMAGAITILGLVGVALAMLLGFEEAPDGLFLVSALCVFAAPIGLLLHLWFTKAMSRREKQSWLKAFVSRRALHAAADYVARQEHTGSPS